MSSAMFQRIYWNAVGTDLNLRTRFEAWNIEVTAMSRPVISHISHSGTGVLTVFADILRNVFRTLRDRREVMQLAELDDHLLKDIGLARSDVDKALGVPLLDNPSKVLVRRTEWPSRPERVDPPRRPIRPVVPLVSRSDCRA